MRPMFHNGERGDAALIFAMVIAAGLGTALYVASAKTNSKQSEDRELLARDRAEQLNISALAEATSLMTFLQTGTQAVPLPSNDATILPYLFPDPYVGNSAVSPTRAAPNVGTWQFQSANLNVYATPSARLHGTNFAALVASGQRPALAPATTVQFVKPLMDATNPALIRAYQATATSTVNGTSVTTSADLPVPRIPSPSCSIKSSKPNYIYQPNESMHFTLYLTGVAASAMVPITSQAVYQGAADANGDGYRSYSLDGRAVSIRNTTPKAMFSWDVPAPRPVAVIVGTINSATYQVTAYVTPVDGSNQISCSQQVTVSAQATCKLLPSISSVPPGSSTYIGYASFGNVQMNTMKLTAQDPGGQDASTFISRSGNGFIFSPPNTRGYGIKAGGSLSQTQINSYTKMLSGLSDGEQAAVGVAMKQEMAILAAAFPSSTPLQNLTITQVWALTGLSDTQLNELPTLDTSRIDGLQALSQAQINALHAADRSTVANIWPVDLWSTDQLSNVDGKTLQQIEGQNTSSLATYLQGLAQASNTPLVYLLTGEIKDANGNTNTCMAHITSGLNPCPYFGNNYGTYTTPGSITDINPSGVFYLQSTINPAPPNWEVNTIADSQTDSVACPASARCFAINFAFNGLTPFFVIDNADSASCSGSFVTRNNIGCFSFHTKVRMADGSDREVHDIKIGDLVWNPLNNLPMRVKRTTLGPEAQPLVVFTAGGLNVEVTTKHPMMVKSGLKAAIDLQLGDELRDGSGVWHKIDQIGRVKTDASVINFELDTASTEPTDHALLAGGLVTGDLYLQEHLAAPDRTKAP